MGSCLYNNSYQTDIYIYWQLSEERAMQTKKSFSQPTEASEANPQRTLQRFPNFIQSPQKMPPNISILPSSERSEQAQPNRPSKTTPPGNRLKIRYSNRHQCIMIEAQLRKIQQKITMEQQLRKNKKMLNRLQEEFQRKEAQLKKKKREQIVRRIGQMEQNKKQRELQMRERNVEMARVKQSQERKQVEMERVLKNSRQREKKWEEDSLRERKKLLVPINFSELNIHAEKYNKTRNKDKDKNISIQVEYSQIHSPSNDQKMTIPLKYLNRCKMKVLENMRGSKNRSDFIRKWSNAEQERVQRVQWLRDIRQKSQQYGNKVEKQFYKNRSQGESMQHFKAAWIKNEQYLKQQKKLVQILSKIKRPNYPLWIKSNEEKKVAVQQQQKDEIQVIKKSKESAERKLRKLGQMSDVELNRISLRRRYTDLEQLNKINITRADILLQME